jgi:large subunit ribosomal protein L33
MRTSVCLTAWLSRFNFSGIQVAGTLTLRRGVSGGRKLNASNCRTSCLPAEVAGHTREEVTMREIITLQCPDCKNRNYSTTKNKKTTTGRLEFSKFCNTCRKHTAHKETK